jgi:hypothetical protein
MMTPDPISGQDSRGAAIAGLRALADFLESNPAVPVGRYAGCELHVFPADDGDAAGRAAVDQVAAVLGVPVTDDTATGGHYYARRSFGPARYAFVHIPPAYEARMAALRSYDANLDASGLPADVAA